MEKKEYKFNPQTLTYEVVTAPFKLRYYRLLRKILVAFILASIFNAIFSYFFYTPKLYRIHRENNELVIKYRILQSKIDASMNQLNEIKHRDNRVYRTLFAADTLSIDGIYAPYPDSKYASLRGDDYSTLMTSTWIKLDELTRKIYLESRSMDELQILAKNKENMSLAVPAIMPIDKKLLKGHIGAYGMRFHPKLHIWRPHKGIDLGGRIGDPVYATGNGTVKEVEITRSRRGYGTQIVIDHEFGYQTRYAHLDKVWVKEGDKIMRGQRIADLGNTGISTGPHLHYEVMYMGHHVNPINYINKNMSTEEFEDIISSARETTYEAD